MPGDAALLLALWATAYLIGAFPLSYLLARYAAGVDLRQHGSGNVGASNLASQLGRRWWLPVAAIDMARGAAPVLVGYHLLGLGHVAWLLILTPLFTIVGNNWSPFLRFSGGRSVGVWAGAVLGISPLLFILGLALYAAGWRVTRRSAEWLLVVMALLPVMALVLPERWMTLADREQIALFAVSGAVLILLKRLVSNGGPATTGVPRSTLVFNRLLRDRDIADREEWLERSGIRGDHAG